MYHRSGLPPDPLDGDLGDTRGMGSADSDDMRPTSGSGNPTIRIGDRYSDEDDADLPPIRPRPRGAKLWLPLVIILVLLAGVIVVGRFVLQPGTPPEQAAPTRTTAAVPASGLPSPAASPSLLNLPTPPPRAADGLADWANQITTVTDIPLVAVEAYGYAQLLLTQTSPACHLGWTTLAAIGSLESDHGRADGAVLEPTGRSDPPIMGPSLDGKSGRALVKDTDAGAYDGDVTFDRELGPLHLLPSMWATYQIDADGDGILDPFDIDDASAALGRLLCGGGQDLNTLATWSAAVARYRPGKAYESAVFHAADSYGQRTRSIG